MPNGFALVSYLVLLYLKTVSSNSNIETHATIIRHFENTGFHRDVYSLVELVNTGQTSFWSSCTLVLIETIPSGLYVNPDQLSDLRRLGLGHSCTTLAVDVEAPESTSLPHKVYIYSKLQKTENLFFADVKFPVHARYHEPVVDGGYVKIDLKSPQLLIQCEEELHGKEKDKVDAPCPVCSKHNCKWLNISYKTNSPAISFNIPVGNLNHLPIVTITTYLLTFGGCLYVLSAVVNKSLVMD